jgi:hypothetical protein
MKMSENDFDAIRPYHQREIPAALKRIASDPLLQQLMNYLFPPLKHEELKQKILDASTTEDFQQAFMLPVISTIIDKTANGLTVSGIEKLSSDSSNVFIANHRDIILDSAILGLALVRNGFITSEITWGDNLILSKFIEDIGKSNRMITVFREGNPKEMLKNSQRLSQYIRQAVTQRNQMVWIAQRKGRAKDGCDSTDAGVLKMLSLSNSNDIIKSLQELNITPLTISYEWEPCDGMKVRELYLTQYQEYVKEEHEDLRSIIGGVVSQKGRIHLNIGDTLNNAIGQLNAGLRKNDLLDEIARLIDQQIHKNYKLWPSNYYAYDLLKKTNQFAEKYNHETIDIFNKRLLHAQQITAGDNEKSKQLFINLYANPVVNQMN